MDIEVSADINAGEWSRLVTEDEAATFFHTSEWSDVLTSTLPGFHSAHVAARDGGRLVAIMPVLGRTRLRTTTLESMAFGTFGGPVLGADAPADAAGAVLAEFAGAAGSLRVGLAQVVDRSGRMQESDLPGFRRTDDALQVVSLEASYEQLEKRFKPSARNKVRKARNAGVTIRRAESETDFLAYHAVLEECSRGWAIRPRPGPEFFSALFELDRNVVQMWLAVHDGDVLAGDLNFALHGTVMNWGNVSTDAAKSLAPNNLLHANAIEQGVRDGHHTYDLGSSGGIDGVRAFKSSFGTADVPVRRFVLEKAWYRALKKAAGRRSG
ncbi:MAG: GNAT family N-acetyltransferase [Candidatus Eisenbacteria sp.]|nr:GNAT family N-acetyltransferase [Candidatus Eisenbacteria bacterium]